MRQTGGPVQAVCNAPDYIGQQTFGQSGSATIGRIPNA